MAGYAAFLRGINLGRRRVKKDALCAPFEALGLENVATFRASGNVLFDAEREPVDELTGRIETALAAALGYDVAVFLRTAAQMRAMAADEPFEADVVAASNGKLQVSLLSEPPTEAARAAVLELATDEDRLAFGPRELYWLPSGGMLESALDLEAIQALVGVDTRRTKGTIDQLTAKFFAD